MMLEVISISFNALHKAIFLVAHQTIRTDAIPVDLGCQRHQTYTITVVSVGRCYAFVFGNFSHTVPFMSLWQYDDTALLLYLVASFCFFLYRQRKQNQKQKNIKKPQSFLHVLYQVLPPREFVSMCLSQNNGLGQFYCHPCLTVVECTMLLVVPSSN